MTGSKIYLYSPVDENDMDVHTVNTQRCNCSMYSMSEMGVYIAYLELPYNSDSKGFPAMHETFNITGYGQDGMVFTWFPQNQSIQGYQVIDEFLGFLSITFVKGANLHHTDFYLILTGKQFSDFLLLL